MGFLSPERKLWILIGLLLFDFISDVLLVVETHSRWTWQVLYDRIPYDCRNCSVAGSPESIASGCGDCFCTDYVSVTLRGPELPTRGLTVGECTLVNQDELSDDYWRDDDGGYIPSVPDYRAYNPAWKKYDIWSKFCQDGCTPVEYNRALDVTILVFVWLFFSVTVVREVIRFGRVAKILWSHQDNGEPLQHPERIAETPSLGLLYCCRRSVFVEMAEKTDSGEFDTRKAMLINLLTEDIPSIILSAVIIQHPFYSGLVYGESQTFAVISLAASTFMAFCDLVRVGWRYGFGEDNNGSAKRNKNMPAAIDVEKEVTLEELKT